MAKQRLAYRCTECGEALLQWAGRCDGCGSWNTLVEEASVPVSPSKRLGVTRHGATRAPVVPLAEVGISTAVPLPTGLGEVDRVLNGGVTPGSVTLLGGEPGIGKSTLVLQMCADLAGRGVRCLLVTGEESAQQVAVRARRLGKAVDGVLLLAETDVETILERVHEVKPHLIVVDSVQTMCVASSGAAPGTVSQVRECAHAFVSLAKGSGVPVVLIGHVTKEGTLAGPRLLEHLVDTVIEFEGDRHHGLRLLRAVKHRFGPTDEVGVLEMTEGGLISVADASGLFLDDRRPGVAGSVVVPAMQGRRPLLVEVQALVCGTKLPQPRRCAQGLDSQRFAIALAVLQKRAGVPVGADDVYASVVGGVRVDEPGVDLPVALAVASSHFGIPLPDDLVAVGEVGLGGEIRKVSYMGKRLGEAVRMGFRRAVVPVGCPDPPPGLLITPVLTLREAIIELGLLSAGHTQARRPPAAVSVPAAVSMEAAV